MAIWTISGIRGTDRATIEGSIVSESESNLETIQIDIDTPGAPATDEVAIESFDASMLQTSLPPRITTDSGDEATEVSPTAQLVQRAGEQQIGSPFIESSVAGRTKSNRQLLGNKNGATDASEAAVNAALAYFARHQRNNGSWTVRFEDGPCDGECDHGGMEKDPHEIAATGLALLCFMGAGHTMSSGEYSEQVNRGVYFLSQSLKIREDGRGTWLTEVAASEMYEHGIATLALCEALQMTGDTALKETCQAAINHIIYAQHADGGWDYHPKMPGDLSIVGWQVMALKSAFSAKIEVPAETIRKVDIFLRRQAMGEFMFIYRAGTKPTASMTAIGTLMKIFRGVSKSDPSIWKAMDYLARLGPHQRDVYFNYYASQALFHFGGKPWSTWNPKTRDYLVKSQDQYGHTAGSWWFAGDQSNETGGRFYVTAMACLTLEVYYRYLPVYESTQEEFKF